ncbi:MAG: TIGR02452 family protein [Clostridium sp.]|nr:TIGR02452 family protein [Clostridium sp.]
MADRRAQLVEVFNDTVQFYREDPALRAAVAYGRVNTRFYDEDDYPEFPEELEEKIRKPSRAEVRRAKKRGIPAETEASGTEKEAPENASPAVSAAERHKNREGQVRVTKERTFQAAVKLHEEFPEKRICVLNFASATRPGGGVKFGSGAQEESLCRCSTLFPTLDRRWLWQCYYDVNRVMKDVRHTDACIYSPKVLICKTDEAVPRRLSPEEFVQVDVLSCAAPNLRNEAGNGMNPETGKPVRMEPDELYALHLKRAKHILHVAAANEADILVLGAFGCGAFMNDPHYVAAAYRDALEEYRAYFDVVEFAIYCRGSETENYRAFAEKLQMYTEK